jgi:hypothetical protein
MTVDTNTAVKIVGTQWISKCLKESICLDTKEFELSGKKKQQIKLTHNLAATLLMKVALKIQAQ